MPDYSTTSKPAGNTPQMAVRGNGAKIAHHLSPGTDPAKPVGVVFLGGFCSDMGGTKAVALENWCQNEGRQFLRFDYTGHGQSSGEFQDGTISQWVDDTVFAVESLTTGPLILVGSSMGGWIMLLAALKIGAKDNERIKGLLGLAAAPDFTEDFANRELTPEQLAKLERDGKIEIENCYEPDDPYIITKALMDDGRKNILLGSEIKITVPIRLIQGMKDQDVPWKTALRIKEMVSSSDVEIQLIKNGDHRLSEPNDLKRMLVTLESLLQQIEETT